MKENSDKKNYEGFSPEKLNQLDKKPFDFLIFIREKWKKLTKPPGRNPRIIQRNKDIQKAYYKLREEQGYTAKKAKEMLAEKYELTSSTIETILKKAP